MILPLLFGILPFSAVQPLSRSSITLPYESSEAGRSIRATVDGRIRTMLLTTGRPYSFLSGVGGAASDVAIEGTTVFRAPLRAPTEAERSALGKAEGGLGLDVLGGMAIGFDYARKEVTLWPGGKLSRADAEAWVGAYPAWGEKQGVRRLSVDRIEHGFPTIAGTLGGRPAKFALSIGGRAPSLEPSVAPNGAAVGKALALQGSVSLAGLEPSWLLYQPAKDKEIGKGLVLIAAEANDAVFGGRRVLIDLAANSVYVEDLSKAIRLSGFLSRLTEVPLELEGDELRVLFPPGTYSDRMERLKPFVGCAVVRLADFPAKDWVDALKNGSEAGAGRLAPMLAKLQSTFRIEVLSPTGQTAAITIQKPS